ncbi:MAG: ASPIC/UnbV domain-containing protein, partial [Planctomycetes bacterium]|nr:ASPIC/UnbV domain-containing protein [Planctomycetota bacterium]
MIQEGRKSHPDPDPEAVNFRGSLSGYEKDCLFYNPDGPYPKFVNAAYLFGLDFDDDGRAAAPVDIDGDGDLDLVLQSLQGLRLVENRMPRRHFARLRLTAAKSHPSALGALVKLTAGGVTQQSFVRMTEGFMSQVPLDLHFGLGDATAVDRIEISWPSGGPPQVLEKLPADRLLEITEGGTPRASELPRWPDATRPKARPAFSFDMTVPKLEGGQSVLATPGRPDILNFWSPTCAPCRKELPALAALAAKHAADAQFAGVSVETADLDSVKATVRDFNLPYPQVLAT